MDYSTCIEVFRLHTAGRRAHVDLWRPTRVIAL